MGELDLGPAVAEEDVFWEVVATDMAESFGNGGEGIVLLCHQSRLLCNQPTDVVAAEELKLDFALGIISFLCLEKFVSIFGVQLEEGLVVCFGLLLAIGNLSVFVVCALCFCYA